MSAKAGKLCRLKEELEKEGKLRVISPLGMMSKYEITEQVILTRNTSRY